MSVNIFFILIFVFLITLLVYRTSKVEKEIARGEGIAERKIKIPRILSILLRIKRQNISTVEVVYNTFASLVYLTIPFDIVYIIMFFIKPAKELFSWPYRIFLLIIGIGVFLFSLGFILSIILSKYGINNNKPFEIYNKYYLKNYFVIISILLLIIITLLVISSQSFTIILSISVFYILFGYIIPYHGTKILLYEDYIRCSGKLIYYNFIYKIENKKIKGNIQENVILITMKNKEKYIIRTIDAKNLVQSIIKKQPKIANNTIYSLNYIK